MLRPIAEAYGKLGDAEKGKQILEKALEVTKSIKGESSQSYVLSQIAAASSKLGDAEKGKQTLEKALEVTKSILEVTKSIKDESSEDSALISIVDAYGKLGDVEKGKQILEKALEVTKSTKEKYSQGSALISIAKSYLNLGDRTRSLSILTDMTRTLNPNSLGVPNKEISALHAEFGNWGEALHFARQCSGSEKVSALSEILRIHAEQQHPEFRELRMTKLEE